MVFKPRNSKPKLTAAVATLATMSLAVLTGCSTGSSATAESENPQRNAGILDPFLDPFAPIFEVVDYAQQAWSLIQLCQANEAEGRDCLEPEKVVTLDDIMADLEDIKETLAANQAQTVAALQVLRLDQTKIDLQNRIRELVNIETNIGQAMEANTQMLTCLKAVSEARATCDVGQPSPGADSVVATAPKSAQEGLTESIANVLTIVGFMDRDKSIAAIASAFSGVRGTGYQDGIAALSWKANVVAQDVAMGRAVTADVTRPQVVTPQLQKNHNATVSYYTAMLQQYGYLRAFVADTEGKNGAAVRNAVATYIDGSITPKNPTAEGTVPVAQTASIYSLPVLAANQLLVTKPDSDQVFRTTNKGRSGTGYRAIPAEAPAGTQVLDFSETLTDMLGKDSYNMVQKAGKTAATADTPEVDVLPTITSENELWAVNQPATYWAYIEGTPKYLDTTLKELKIDKGNQVLVDGLSSRHEAVNVAAQVAASPESSDTVCQTGIRFHNPGVKTERRQTEQGVLLYPKIMDSDWPRNPRTPGKIPDVIPQMEHNDKVVFDVEEYYTNMIRGNADFNYHPMSSHIPAGYYWGFDLGCGELANVANTFNVVTFEELPKPKIMGDVR